MNRPALPRRAMRCIADTATRRRGDAAKGRPGTPRGPIQTRRCGIDSLGHHGIELSSVTEDMAREQTF